MRNAECLAVGRIHSNETVQEKCEHGMKKAPDCESLLQDDSSVGFG